jgi:hypothetical protein
MIVCQNSLRVKLYYATALTGDFPMLKHDEQRKYHDCLISSLPICVTSMRKDHEWTAHARKRYTVIVAYGRRTGPMQAGFGHCIACGMAHDICARCRIGN